MIATGVAALWAGSAAPAAGPARPGGSIKLGAI
jgi:hypothetical protein